MIVRVADLTLPDQDVADRAIETMASVALPLVQNERGFEGGWLLLGDPQGAALVTVWKDEASHDAAVERMTEAMLAIAATGAIVRYPIRRFDTVIGATESGVQPAGTVPALTSPRRRPAGPARPR